MTENLNIQYHTAQLIVKALNREPTVEAAAKVLGIPERTLFNLMKQYNIKRVVPYKIVKNQCK